MGLLNVFIVVLTPGRRWLKNIFISNILDSQIGKLKWCLLILVPTCPCCSFIFLLGITFCYAFSNYCTTDTSTWNTTFVSPFSTKGWKKGFCGNRSKLTKPEHPSLKNSGQQKTSVKSTSLQGTKHSLAVPMCGCLCLTASLLQKVGTQPALLIESQLSLK